MYVYILYKNNPTTQHTHSNTWPIVCIIDDGVIHEATSVAS